MCFRATNTHKNRMKYSLLNNLKYSLLILNKFNVYKIESNILIFILNILLISRTSYKNDDFFSRDKRKRIKNNIMLIIYRAVNF